MTPQEAVSHLVTQHKLTKEQACGIVGCLMALDDLRPWHPVLGGFRFATLLSAMRQCLEASDVERRLAELEAELEVDSNVVKFPGRGAA